MNLNGEFELVIEADYPEDASEVFYDVWARVAHNKLKSLDLRDVRVVRMGRHLKVLVKTPSFYTLYQLVLPAATNIIAADVGDSLVIHVSEFTAAEEPAVS